MRWYSVCKAKDSGYVEAESNGMFLNRNLLS
jgi:hypothetical protein